MDKGWFCENGKWYYFNSRGELKTGWLCDDKNWYYLNNLHDGTYGAMLTNRWICENENWFFLTSTGRMAIGWHFIQGNWYYFYQNGIMAANTITPDGFYINSNGIWDGRSAEEVQFINEWTSRINNYLSGSPLAGCGEIFAEAAWIYGVDPRVGPAIACVESGKGRACWQAYNAWGWMAYLGSSWEESIYNWTRQFAYGYGYTVTYGVAQKYCESSDAWYDAVTNEMWNI